MAQYQHLPIYRTAYQLLMQSTQIVRGFPREYKYTLGQKLKEEIIEIIVLVYRANSTRRKRDYIEELLARVQVASLMVRLAHDLRIVSTKHYAALAELADSIGRQASGWAKSVGHGVQPELSTPTGETSAHV